MSISFFSAISGLLLFEKTYLFGSSLLPQYCGEPQMDKQ